MKKIIALGLAVASCVSIACAASSTCEIGFNYTGVEQPIEYTITIPSELEFKVTEITSSSMPDEIKAPDTLEQYRYTCDLGIKYDGYIGKDNKISMDIVSANGYKLINDRVSVSYAPTIYSAFGYFNGTNDGKNTVHLNVANAAFIESFTSTIRLSGTASTLYDGKYTDTLTFNYDLADNDMMSYTYDVLSNGISVTANNFSGDVHRCVFDCYIESDTYTGDAEIYIYFYEDYTANVRVYGGLKGLYNEDFNVNKHCMMLTWDELGFAPENISLDINKCY